MPLMSWPWRPWEQTRAIENARSASTELCRQRVERDEVEAFLARILAARTGALYDAGIA